MNPAEFVKNYPDGESFFPTPLAHEPGVKAERLVDKDGNVPTHTNQRLYDRHTGRLVQKGLSQVAQMFPTPQTRGFTNDGDLMALAAVCGDYEEMKGMAYRACDGKKRKFWPTTDMDGTGDRLDHFVGDTATARLSPDWVEWLMLWPVGWTALEPLPENAFFSMQPCGEPDGLPRVTAKCDNRAARLKAIGNGQVPLCAATAFTLLMGRFLC